MVGFNYVIKDSVGIHARPASLLVKKAKELSSKTVINARGKSAEATRLMAIMSLGIKKGDEINVQVTGENEKADALEMESFFKNNL